MKKKNLISVLSLSLIILFIIPVNGQIKEYRIHDRGMLHNTTYNTGDIGRGWMTGEAGNKTNIPLFEWPPRSRVFVDGIEYSGQHNLLGGGIYIAANPDGRPGLENRQYAFCGGVGASEPEVVFGRWSFPLSMEERENFPVLPDGTLNPDYDPDEAEEIITSSWATPIGVTITRTSRAWSYPDYDDMIIYEYELEYTGDTDGNPATIETTETLKDFMTLLIYGFGPSMYGYQRHYGEWKYDAGIYRGDQRNFWDSDYWLSFNLDVQTALDPLLAGKPEPNRELFKRFAETGENGGGLCSPQAPGYVMLYYDLNHLAVIDPVNAANNESEAVRILRTSAGVYYELDENLHMKQPWANKVSTGNTRSSKMMLEAINPDKRWSGVLSEGSTTWPEVPDPRWYGRAAYNYRQCNDGGQKHLVFGPYTLKHGDKLRYALAEVVGYGAQENKRVEGGDVSKQWNLTPSWNRRVVINGEVLTEHYLDDYGYPDYVNSDVKTVTQVAHNAFKAYIGEEPVVPVWPESNPPKGSYKIPVPYPAPAIVIANTDDGKINIQWLREVENFTHPRLMSPALAKFRVYRSNSGMGPWKLLSEFEKGNVNEDGVYEFIDEDPDFKIGEMRYYSITSVDAAGNESGRTNITRFQKNIGAVEKMTKVYAVPNPFISRSGFEGSGEVEDKIGFYGLPAKCTIRIFSYSGQLIETLEHDTPLYSTEYFQITRNGQEIASGIYFYVVTTPEGDTARGKFIVIK
jgi:hypothetical protein